MDNVVFCKVPIKKGEMYRRKFMDLGIFNNEYKIIKKENSLLIPIIDENILINIYNTTNNYENDDIKIVYLSDVDLFKNKKKDKKTFRQYLIENYSDYIESGDISLSYDIIGDIVILQISDKIDDDIKKDIGKNAIELIPSISTVFRKKSSVSGEYRIRELEFIGGEYKTLTLYKENGYRLWVDVEKVYFSPRLGWERKRIMDLVNSNDVVVDMFAGVGPFSICCKKSRKIYSIDINPYAIDLLKKNIVLNKLQHKIEPILGDVRDVELKGDRIIMNLPKYSHYFIDKAMDIVNKGGTIHYYTVGKNFKECEEFLLSKINCSILNKRIVKSYSPKEYIMVFDLKVFE